MTPAPSLPDQFKSLVKRIIDFGAVEARVVKASSVVTANWVRLKWQYGCDGYGYSLCCPPNTPTPEETRKVIDGYETALLAHFRVNGSATRPMVTLEREAFLRGYYSAFAFGASPAPRKAASIPIGHARPWKLAGLMCLQLHATTAIRYR